LTRGVRDGGLYRLLVDLVEQGCQEATLEEYHSSLVEIISKHILEPRIYSMIVADGSIEEYQNMFVDEGFSQKEGIDLVDAFGSVGGGFEVHG
jgi:hypothetical protein